MTEEAEKCLEALEPVLMWEHPIKANSTLPCLDRHY